VWTRVFRALAAGIDLLLPPACLLCGQQLPPMTNPLFLCRDCLACMPPLGPAHCPCCARPYPSSSANHLCGVCLRQSQFFTTVHAAGLYLGTAREAVHRLKFRDQLALASPLGQLLGQAVTRNGSGFRPHRIVPVPLHPRRLRQRGFNQALEIARPLSRRMGVSLDTRLLIRTRPTPPQQELPATARRSNLRNAFDLTAKPAKLRILLVDDVMTTGETVRECSRVLLAGGASEVQVAVFARA
jgi:ComF family protein